MIVLDASAVVDWLLLTSAGQSIEKPIHLRTKRYTQPGGNSPGYHRRTERIGGWLSPKQSGQSAKELRWCRDAQSRPLSNCLREMLCVVCQQPIWLAGHGR
jgi:hypothetical protein